MNSVFVEMMKVITASDRWGSEGRKFTASSIPYPRIKIFTAKLLQQPITSSGSIHDEDLHSKLCHKDNLLTVEEE
jgi:hypothetical protein